MSLNNLTRRTLFTVGQAPALRSCMLKSTYPILAPSAKRWASSSSGVTPTTKMTPQENIALLNAQRLHRPNSPHLSIYQPQLTWYPSIFNRITGVGLSGVLYAASLVYLFHPLYPALDSAHLISLVHSLPTWVKGGIKFVFAVPFTFHTFNGIRHLAWDTGFGLTIKGVYTGVYIVMAATAVSSIWLAFFV